VRLAYALVAAVLALNSCSTSETSIVVLVRTDGVVPPVAQLRVMVSNAGVSDLRSFPANVGDAGSAMPILFPASFALIIPSSRSGVVDLAIDAFGATSMVVANGDTSATIDSGGQAYATIVLRPGASACGNFRVETDETCDDGNRVSGDGCSFRCHVEPSQDAGLPGSEGGAPAGGIDAGKSGAGGAGAADVGVDAAAGIDSGSCQAVDFTRDADNCGGCGYRCVNGRSCQNGRCTPAWLPTSINGGPPPRIRHGAAFLAGRIVISGGTSEPGGSGSRSDCAFYDLATDSWSAGPPLNQSRCAHTSVSGGGEVFVFGGLSDCGNGSTTGPGLEEYDPRDNVWRVVSAAGEPTARYNASSIWLRTGEMLILGGGGSDFSTTDSGARFNLDARTWRAASCSLPGCATGKGAFLTFEFDIVYWAAGLGPPGMRLDVAQNTWSSWMPPAGSPAQPAQFAEDSRRGFVLNGENGEADCPSTVTVHMFDKLTGTWTTDSTPAPPGIGVTASSSNHTVWTGSELFVWSAQCDPKGVGWRYQPPAPWAFGI
jgi:cysteine-rich repeat protein